MRVDVCIATYCRAAALAALLRSLVGQQVPADVSMRLLVVDNDAARSAKWCQGFDATPHTLEYHAEPVRGIAPARARALSLATGDLLAFIDDDEFAPPCWLATLIAAHRAHDADVVFGPVLPVYSADTPAWIRRGGFFERPRRPTGTRVRTGGTGNALVRRVTLERLGVGFDTTFRMAGEDTDFFSRLHRAGALLVWCDEAVVHEPVPSERMSVRWLVHRAFTSGRAFARSEMQAPGVMHTARWWLRRLGLLFVATLVVVPAALLRIDWAVHALQKIASNAGQLSTVFASNGHRGVLP